MGGALADSLLTWRWSFYLRLCLGGLIAPFYLLLMPMNPSDLNVEPLQQRIQNFDVFGSLLIIGRSLSLVMALSFGRRHLCLEQRASHRALLQLWRSVHTLCSPAIVLHLYRSTTSNLPNGSLHLV